MQLPSGESHPNLPGPVSALLLLRLRPYLQILHVLIHLCHLVAALLQDLAGAEHGRVVLHGLLHLHAQVGCGSHPVGVAQGVQVRHGRFAGVLATQRCVQGVVRAGETDKM